MALGRPPHEVALRLISMIKEAGVPEGDHLLAWLYGPIQHWQGRISEGEAEKMLRRFSIFQKATSAYPVALGTTAARDAFCFNGEEGALAAALCRAREAALRRALSKVGLFPRRDSLMCKRYVRGEFRDLGEVVAMMVEMQWLFDNTNYRAIMAAKVAERPSEDRLALSAQSKREAVEGYLRRLPNGRLPPRLQRYRASDEGREPAPLP